MQGLHVVVAPLPGASNVARGGDASVDEVVGVLLAFHHENDAADLRLLDHLGQAVQDTSDAGHLRRAVCGELTERLALTVVARLQPLHGEQQFAVLVDVRVLRDDLRALALLQGLVEEVAHGEAEPADDVLRVATGVAVEHHAVAVLALPDGQGRGPVLVGRALC